MERTAPWSFSQTASKRLSGKQLLYRLFLWCKHEIGQWSQADLNCLFLLEYINLYVISFVWGVGMKYL